MILSTVEFPGIMSETTTFAPFLASSTAMDCPMPLAAPVTIAILFFRLNISTSIVFGDLII